MNAKQRVAASQAEQPDDLAANERGCDRISLRAAPMKRNITPNQPGIRGMSVYRSARYPASPRENI
jgi:hypothetical protein